MKLIALMKRQLDQKKAECESLAYRLRNHGLSSQIGDEEHDENEI